MNVVHNKCAGIDVHKRVVVVCINVAGRREVRTFYTSTRYLKAMMRWLEAEGIEIVAMESTGVYWKPVWNILEDSKCQLMLVNAHHIKQVPGRKTDVKDAEWIAELLRHGLLTPSNVPNRDQRELRELTRYRHKVTQERGRTVTRIQKTLEGGNIKMSSVVSDLTGVSGRAMLDALVGGQTDAAQIANLAVGKLKNKHTELEEALEGNMTGHQRFMLTMLLNKLRQQDRELEHLDREIKKRMRPFEPLIKLLDSVPGIAQRGAEEVLAEIGPDMDRYPSAHHLASWAKLCPGNSISAGKRTQGKRAPSSPYVRSLMIQLAWGATRKKGSYHQAYHKRVSGRRGSKRAVVAVAHSMLVSIYHMLSENKPYNELGSDYFDQINKEKVVRRARRRLEKLGYEVVEKQAA